MSKADTLLKKATFFERLALYSDRKAFLQSIAQTTYSPELTNAVVGFTDYVRNQPGLPDQVKNVANEIDKYLRELPPDQQGTVVSAVKQLVGRIWNELRGSVDSTVLAELGRRSGIVDDAYAKIQAQPKFDVPSAAPQRTITLPTIEYTSPRQQATTSKFPAIDKTFQIMLGVNPDGALGPQTQAAIDLYKKSRNITEPGNTVAYVHLAGEPEYFSKKPMAFDDNSNVYLKSPGITREAPF